MRGPFSRFTIVWLPQTQTTGSRLDRIRRAYAPRAVVSFSTANFTKMASMAVHLNKIACRRGGWRYGVTGGRVGGWCVTFSGHWTTSALAGATCRRSRGNSNCAVRSPDWSPRIRLSIIKHKSNIILFSIDTQRYKNKMNVSHNHLHSTDNLKAMLRSRRRLLQRGSSDSGSTYRKSDKIGPLMN